MKSIAFIDSEIDPQNGKILDIGSVKDSGEKFHKSSRIEFVSFISGTHYICGHNIYNHDLKYLGKSLSEVGVTEAATIDTLYLSPLLFPTRPYHALLKDDKIQSEELNNPLNDAIKTRDLFYDEVTAFRQTDHKLQQIFYLLLADKKEFGAFFRFVRYDKPDVDLEPLIRKVFKKEICENADLPQFIAQQPVELAYCLALINSFVQHENVHSIIPRWVLKNYPDVERLMFRLRSTACITGCDYCDQFLDAHHGLKRYFGFEAYRSYGGEPLQEKAVKAAIANKSILAVFPTGGGKSITFQVPALMSGERSRALTIVISPLQSLMKDQVDNLEKAGITEAVTINGLLDPIERAKSYERVEDGSASILYISPESLRSKTIERLVMGRKIARFVIDEAHCFSSWGQDFRVDYLYIGDFIKLIQEKKNLDEGIPVSCFTATAKQKVIEDIRSYFEAKLSLHLELFTSKASRTNLQYKVFEKGDEEDKYQAVRDLIEIRNCPTIIYVSRTRKAYLLAERLLKDGFSAKPYHGKMDKQEKSENQDSFISGQTQIMVATSAFGMGVDKKDVGMVIHYEISDSLENYVQEAGRAGRDESITAECFVLFDEEDLSKHFILLNQTKLSIKEIQQVWRAIKDITRFRSTVSNSALEIARKAGWDDSVAEIETRVTTAIAALEDAGYLRRGQNMPRIFANSILAKNAQEAIDRIHGSPRFSDKQRQGATRIIKKLFSSKSKKQIDEETAESRIDYISDHLGLIKEEVIAIINLLREEKILADTKDLTAFIKKGENRNRSLHILDTFSKIENFVFSLIDEQENVIHLKELNELGAEQGVADISPQRLRIIFNFWAIKHWIKRKNVGTKNHIAVLPLQPRETWRAKLQKRHELAKFIVEYLYEKTTRSASGEDLAKDELLVSFSVHEVKEAYDTSLNLFKTDITIDDVEDTLFYLSRIDALKIEGGFLVVYNQLTIERTEQNNKKQYTKDDYQKLHQFYVNKVQQIHIVGEYAKKMIEDYRSALQFVEDYFQLNYASFLHKYFPASRQDEIKRNITPAKFRQLFGELSPTQLKIINDNETKNIVVAAGPGSGKTRVLVHKLASLLLMEDVKHEQLLMITFSRAAATEFKKRLLELIGNAAHYIEIKTFHSYCFDLLGKVGSLEKSGDILKEAIHKIRHNEVEANRITKSVLVVDEAQDMDNDEFALIGALMKYNEEMRVIAVGDDDQNIYEFRGASAKYLEQFIQDKQAAKHELVENYRSKSNLVAFSNHFVRRVEHRLKRTDIIPIQRDNGRIKIVRHVSSNLITPLVNDIMNTGLSGTVCVLTKTNEEALQISSLLLRNKIQARLIQSNEGFSVYNLAEVRYFLSKLDLTDGMVTISDEMWLYAKRELFKRYRHSSKLDVVGNIIRDFDATSSKRKYISDLEVFIRESKLEDFFNENGETVFVSTIHKAKGKEFDNVFLLLDTFSAETDAEKRLLYVALTRAKNNISIHLNNGVLDDVRAMNMERIQDHVLYPPPHELAMHLSHKDVWLDYFINRQHLIDPLQSGDRLGVRGHECLDTKGNPIVKFSRHFLAKTEEMAARGYRLKEARINFILYWQKENTDQEVKIILPELYFERMAETVK